MNRTNLKIILRQIQKVKLVRVLLDEFKDNEIVTFLVKFKESANPTEIAEVVQKQAILKDLSPMESKFLKRSSVVSELKTVSTESQQNVTDFLEKEKVRGNVLEFTSFFIVNGMAVTASKDIAEKIAEFAEVEKILQNEKHQLNEGPKEDIRNNCNHHLQISNGMSNK